MDNPISLATDAITRQRNVRIRRAGRIGAVIAAVAGGFFGLIAPLTLGVGGFALIYVAPWVNLPAVPLWAALVPFGALQWIIPGWLLGRFLASITGVRPQS